MGRSLPGRHDRTSEPPARPSGGDVLSDVLHGVRLTGSVFFVTRASAPWIMHIPDGATLASAILPRAQNVMSYHVVTRGCGWGGLPDESLVPLEAGDVLVFPHGDPYVMCTSRGLRGGPARAELLAFFREMAAGHLPFVVREGGGGAEQLELVCGFLGCDAHPFNPLLAALPRFVHVRRAGSPDGDSLGSLVQLTLAEARDPLPGAESVRLRLGELLFVEVVRRHLAALPDTEAGWLAGLRDPLVGRALTLLHERAAHPWTLALLAREVGSSRSTLADRFAQLVGQPPMQYLTRWRMQLAARLLADSTAKIARIASDVGYDSAAAFSRAFKKLTGASPAAWRRQADAAPR